MDFTKTETPENQGKQQETDMERHIERGRHRKTDRHRETDTEGTDSGGAGHAPAGATV